MQIDTKQVKKSFEKSIDKYSKHAVVQQNTAEKLVYELAKINPRFDKVLEIGSGSGVLTELVCKNLKFREYSANDLTEKSETYVKKIVPNEKFYCGDFRRINFNKKFNLIISNAVFQWFETPEKVLDKCFNLLNSGGVLAFSTFDKNNFTEIKQIAGLSLAYKSKEEWENLLHNRFELLYSFGFEQVLTFSNPLEIFAHIKNTGVNALGQAPMSIVEIKQLCEKYRTEFPGLTLTYAPLIFIAVKR